jgi:uncharacterized membrane protein
LSTFATLARWTLAGSIVAICALTFVWPFTVSPDPSHPGFRVAAIATLVCFLAALVAILVEKACRVPRT